jgi:hypothetical protein
MTLLRKIIRFLTSPLASYREKQRLKKRIEELKKRDPFIYK